ncbi:MAG TPA: hypothetical protein VEK80_06210 [Kribbellaceae bacterium]|nr:hypothetical protein [Kribbellaceae bacterium]
MADSDAETAVCSARGCSRPATWQLLWNNPRLHTPDRRKVWTACDEHKESLSDFLARRSFLREVEPLGSAADR